MQHTSLSSKGQIVIPKAIREQHGWNEGTKFKIEETYDGILISPIKRHKPLRAEDVAGCLNYNGPAKTLKDMEDAIKTGAKKHK